jgi:hypothetical protein
MVGWSWSGRSYFVSSVPSLKNGFAETGGPKSQA